MGGEGLGFSVSGGICKKGYLTDHQLLLGEIGDVI